MKFNICEVKTYRPTALRRLSTT